MSKKSKKAKKDSPLANPTPKEANEINAPVPKEEASKPEILHNIIKTGPKPTVDNNKTKLFGQSKAPNSDTYEDTVISAGAEINGSIVSRGAILVNGKVTGNISSEANIRVTGSVEGDISGKSVEIQNGSVVGNLKSVTSITISEESSLKGDIECESLVLNGNVEGNSQVHTSAKLGEKAIIFGDLTTQKLSIQEGATVNGAIKVNREKEPLLKDEEPEVSPSQA